MPIRLKALIYVCSFALAGAAHAWVTGVDPSAASFPLVGRNSTVGYTGEFNWSETLMTVPGRNGLDVNLVLTYSGNIGVDQEASWVGLGFDLAVGYITRQTINMPDEVEPEHPNDPFATDMGAFYWGKEAHQWDDPMTGEEAGQNFIKPQDKFFMVLPGGGCELIAAGPEYEERTVGGGDVPGDSCNDVDDIMFHAVNWRAWKVDPEFSYYNGQRYISSFTVTTEDGTVYIFDKCLWSQLSIGQINRNYWLQDHPYEELYDNPKPGWNPEMQVEYPGAPYIWYLTEIRSPDYVDANSNSQADDGDKGNWVKITYDAFTGAYPKNPASGYEYWTRFESYHRTMTRVENPPLPPMYWCDDFLRQNKTKIHLAVIGEIETPTHTAEFETSYRENADAVAYIDNSTGHRHPKKLDKITLRSKYGNDGVVSEVHFSYLPNVQDEILAWDEHPVTDEWQSYAGGRLTLKEVQLYGKDGEGKLPPYQFEYEGVDCPYRLLYDCFRDETNAWGEGPWGLKIVNFPTGGEMEVFCKEGWYHYIQDYEDFYDEPKLGPDHVSWIAYRTKFDPGETDTRMDFRRVDYTYGPGVALMNPEGGPDRYKTSAGLYSLSNYVGYDSVWAETKQKFADPREEDPGIPTWWDETRTVITDYITARERPDEILGVEPVYRFTSNEWKRGMPERVYVLGGDEITYGYNEHEMWTFEGKYLTQGQQEEDYYIVSGWKRLASEESEVDGVSRRTVYCHDPPSEPGSAECENCNGLPRQIEVYRDTGGGDMDVGEAGKNTAYEAAGELTTAALESVGDALLNVVKGKADAGDAAAGLTRDSSRVAGGLWDDFRDNLDGWEKVRTTFLTYAYDQSGAPYSEMVYGQKHMMSQKYRVGVRDHSGNKLSVSEIHYHDFHGVNGIRIYPDESWVWLDKNDDSTITEDEKIFSTYEQYDDYGNLTEVIDPKGRHSETEYSDTYNYSLPTSFENALEHVTTVEYDDVQSTVVKVTDPNNLVTEYKYDNLGRLVAVWYPNRPKLGNEEEPSVKYRYNWAQYGEIDLTRPWKGINWVRTAKLLEDPGQTRYAWATSFYNGLGELFRTIKHYNAPLLDEQTQEPVEGYWQGMYYDVETNTLGLTSRRFVPYEADEWRIDGVQPGKEYSIRVPFPLNDSLYGPDEEYRPFWETIYELGSLGGPRVAEVYGPATYDVIDNGYYPCRTVRRARYGSIANNVYPHPDPPDARLGYVEGYDEEGRATKKYYDSLGRHVLTCEGAEYDVYWPFGEYHYGQWGDPLESYITTTTFIYDELDRLTYNLAANSSGLGNFETDYSYDTLSRMTSVSDPDRGLLTYGYDEVGNLVAFQDPELAVGQEFVGYTYDDLNRVLSEGVYDSSVPGGDGDDAGVTFSAGFDIFGGRVPLYDTSTDTAAAKRAQGKDLSSSVVGKKIRSLFDDLDVDVKITYHYDEYPSGQPGDGGLDDYPTDYPVGKLTWTEDLIGKKNFYYDNMGRAVATASDRCYFDNDVLAHEYYYNIGGQLTSEKYPSGTQIYYEYDAIGRLINIPGFYGGESAPDYDAGPSFNPRDGPAPRAPGINVASRILPSLKARRLTVERNPQARMDYLMAGINPLSDEDSTTGFDYDERGRLEYIRPGNARQTILTYDVAEHQLISEIRFDMAENYLDDIVYWYSYEGNRNVTQIIDSLQREDNNRKRIFEYDTLNRLTRYEVGWDTGGMDVGKTVLSSLTGGIDGVRRGLAGGYDGGGLDAEEPGFPPYQFYCAGGVRYSYDEVGNRQYEERNSLQYYYTYENNKNTLASDPWGNTYTYNDNGALASKYNGITHDTYDYTYDYAGRLIKIQKQGGDDDGANDEPPAAVTPGTPAYPAPNNGGTASPMAPGGTASAAAPAAGSDDADSSFDYLDPSGGPFVTEEEEWEFTYDGSGAKVYKVSDVSASKYVLDAGGRAVMEFSNDIRKSSANVVMNPSFEIYSTEAWSEPDKSGDNSDDLARDAVAGVVATAERTVTDAVEDTQAFDAVEVGDFGYWTEYTGEATAGGICCDVTDPVEGKLAVKIWRPASCGYDFRLKQVIPIKDDPPRTYEVRFFAKASADLSGRAYVHLTTEDAEIEPEDDGLGPEGFDLYDAAAATLDSVDINGEEWREYRMAFAAAKAGLCVQLVLDKAASGAVYFDRFSAAEYQNDLENASFEDGELYPTDSAFDFEEWEEENSGGVVELADGILTTCSAKVARTQGGVGVPPTEVWQSEYVYEGRTYEFTAAAKVESLTNAQAYIIAEMEGGGWAPYYVALPAVGASDWQRYTGYYVAPADGFVKLRLGVEGEGTGVAYFEDAGMKEIPDVCENNDFEDWGVEPTDSTIEFIAWTAELNGGDVVVDTASPHMNGAAAVLTRVADAISSPSPGTVERLLGRGFDADPISNTILKQRINCLPRTEYEVTVFVKHNITAKSDYYGAFAIVGNITGSYQIDAITLYTGDYVEVCNLDAGASGWTAYTARYTSSEDWFEVTLGVGATCAGSATFDGILIRDLTTRRYEYIYGLGRKLATLEYEGNVPEGQLYFEHHDLLGSPVMRTDIDGAVVWKGDYAPFGETLEEQPVTWGSQYSYMGNEDDGGLMDFGARFYDPRVGRFTSPDPIKDVSSANVVNPYAYCANNPLRYTDKFGLSKAPVAKPPPEEGGGPAGGGHASGFGWEAMDPIPFSSYPVYYGASINGRQAWIYSNEVKYRAKQEAKKAILADANNRYHATMAASNALLEHTKFSNVCAEMIEMLSTYSVGMAGVGSLSASFSAAMAASEGGFVADVSAVSGSAADDMGSAFEGRGTGYGVASGGDDPSFTHAIGQALIGACEVSVGGGVAVVTSYAVIVTRGGILLDHTARVGVVAAYIFSYNTIYDGFVNNYRGSVPEAVAAAINSYRNAGSGPYRTRSVNHPPLNPNQPTWPDYRAEIHLEERWPK